MIPKYEQDLLQAEAILLEVAYSSAPFGWVGAVAIVERILDTKKPPGEVVAAAARRNPKVVGAMFCRN